MRLYIVFYLFLCGCTFIQEKEWGSDCDYVLPNEYRIVQNPEGKYAIGIGGRVLQYSIRWHDFTPGDANQTSGVVDRFDDSCEAKGMVKAMKLKDSLNRFK